MKITSQKQVLSLAIVLLASVTIVGFTSKSRINKHSDRLLMVGLAYNQKKCGSASFSEAFSWEYAKNCFGGDHNEMAKRIKTNLYNSYGVDEQNVSIKSSTQPFAVIISYKKEIAGWGCSVKRFAVGFGNSLDAAQQDAMSNKNNDDAGSSWQFETYVNCNN